jgi:Avidin family
MSRALRLVTAVAVIATAGLTAAQSPTTPSTPTTPTMPTSPTTPTTPPATIADGIQPMPAGRSTWRSQDGSVVDLTVDSTAGTVTGTFTPGFPCGFASTLTPASRPLVGTVNGNAVAWTLSLTACPSVGTWVGHFQTTGTEEQLTMLFTLAVPESPPGVGSTLTGPAVFVRQTAGATP